jgi:hypothetical protein
LREGPDAGAMRESRFVLSGQKRKSECAKDPIPPRPRESRFVLAERGTFPRLANANSTGGEPIPPPRPL